MTVYDSSMLELEATDQSDSSQVAVERQEFDRIMDAAVNPALEMCSRMADLKKDGTVWEKEIFLANCTSYLQVCLADVLLTSKTKSITDCYAIFRARSIHSFSFIYQGS